MTLIDLAKLTYFYHYATYENSAELVGKLLIWKSKICGKFFYAIRVKRLSTFPMLMKTGLNKLPVSTRRRYNVEIWLKIGWTSTGWNFPPASFCERWFNICNQTSIQRQYNVRRFDLKSRRCFNVGFRWVSVDEISNVISTLFQRWKSYLDPIFNLFSSTSINSTSQR